MCNEIYVPKIAFINTNENTTFETAKPSKETVDRIIRYYKNLLEQGYSPGVAKQHARERLKLFFEIFMARNYKQKNQTEKQ